MNRKFNMLAGTALTVLAFAPGLAAHAQSSNTLSDVVVTATKTGATNLQKTPLSVDVLGSADLKKEGVESFRDLQMELPSVKLLTNGTNPRVYIRGVGGFNSNDGEVSLYVDGVFISRPTEVTQTPFNDLDRVEVLEGPQGTLFGRNSVGGAINFISKVPSDHFTFNNTLSVGNFALIDEEASVSGPIADNMQASLAVTKFQHSGYEHNLVVGAGDANAANRFGARGQIRWEITPDITNTVRADYSYTNEVWQTGQNPLVDVSSGKEPGVSAGCPVVYTPGTAGCGFNYAPLFTAHIGDLRNVVYARVPHNAELVYGVSDEFNWKLNDHLTLKSVTAGRTDNSSQDQGNTTEVITAPPGPQLFYEYEVTQEFNLIHEYGPLSGVVGLYYYLDSNHYVVFAPTIGGTPKAAPSASAGFTTGQDTWDPTSSKAAFIEESYHITPTLKITAGARYSQDLKTFNTYNFSTEYDPGNVGCPTAAPCDGAYAPWIAPQPGNFHTDLNYLAHSTTPKLAVDWQATPDIMVYASATSGYKSGGFNETSRWCVSTGLANQGPVGSSTATCPVSTSATAPPNPAVINVPPPLGVLYGPENMWAYEAGIRSDWFDHTLRVNLSFFRYNWSGLQFSASIAPQTIVTSNAGNAQTNGMEAAITYKPAPGLTIDFHATVLDAKYISFNAYSVPTNLKVFLPTTTLNSAGQPIGKGLYTDTNGNSNLYNASGNKLVDAPPISLSVAVQKDFDLANGADLFVRGEYEYQGQVFFDPTNAIQDAQAAYSIVNGSVGYSPAHSHWTVALWGKNMADTRYIVGAQSGGGCLCAAIGDPRTFGVRVNYTY